MLPPSHNKKKKRKTFSFGISFCPRLDCLMRKVIGGRGSGTPRMWFFWLRLLQKGFLTCFWFGFRPSPCTCPPFPCTRKLCQRQSHLSKRSKNKYLGPKRECFSCRLFIVLSVCVVLVVVVVVLVVVVVVAATAESLKNNANFSTSCKRG